MSNLFRRLATPTSNEANLVALVKGGERYVFIFDDENRVETLRQFWRFAANPDLTFSWYDAAVLSQRLRADAEQQTQKA